MLLDILLYACVFFLVIQLLYYLVIFARFAFHKTIAPTPKKIPISVIVCAKNEEQHIDDLVPLLAQQDYPEFEIVLIDDASTDETLEKMMHFEKQYTNIKLVKVVNNEAFWGNKKYALTLGIKAAKYEYLLFTDADCRPASNQWIKEMSAHFTIERTIVLGYGAYKRIPGFLNKLIRFETLLAATHFFSWAKIGKPFMGVGRNLAYKKETFFAVRGFMDHMHIRSGDDDLFVNQAANEKNTALCLTENSFTYSDAETTFKGWFKQKRRHLSTAGNYHFFDQFQLALFFVSQFVFLALSILLLAFMHQWIIVLALLFVRYLTTWIILGKVAKRMKEKDLIFLYPIAELVLITVQISLFFFNLFSKPTHWK